MKHEIILAEQAIKAALEKNWQEAIEKNKEILEIDGENISALNRLANAYIELKRPEEAEKTIKKILKLDKENPVALKNRKRLNEPSHQEEPPEIIEGFIKEPGKTKVIEIESPLSEKQLAHLTPAEQLKFTIKRKRIYIEDSAGHEIGRLEKGYLSEKIMTFLKKNLDFKLTLTALEKKNVTILIRSPEPIFPPEDKPPEYRPYTARIQEDRPLS